MGRSLVPPHSVTKIVARMGAHALGCPRWAPPPSSSGSTGRRPVRSRCTSAASGASSTCATGANRPRASGSPASGSGTPTSSTCSRRARCARCGSSSTTTGSAISSWSSSGTGSSTRTTSAARPPTRDARSCSRRLPPSPPTTSRSATSPARNASSSRSSSGSASSARTPSRHTDAAIAYEFMPYDVNVNDVEKALAVVEGANAPNGGLALDTWHLGKLRLEPDELRRIPPRFLSWVELCDGPYEYAEDRLDEVINRRRLPGEGEFPDRRLRGRVPGARLRRPVGRRGALRRAPQPSDRADLRTSLRRDASPARPGVARKEPRCPRTACRRNG